MKALVLIIQREYATAVKTKAFLITTILMPIVMALMIVLPTVFMKMDSEDIKKVYVIDKTKAYFPLLESSDKYLFIDFDGDPATISQQEGSGGEMYALLTIDAMLNDQPAASTFFSEKQQPPRELIAYINDVLTSAVKNKNLKDYTTHINIDTKVVESLQQILNSKDRIRVTTKQWDGDGKEKDTAGEAVTFIGMGFTFLMFFFIMMNGSLVMQSVVEEKTNRIVEVIISSAKPFDLMLGKIIAVALTGFTQLLIWLVIGVVGFGIYSGVMGFDIDASTMSSMMVGGADMDQLSMMMGGDTNMITESLAGILSVNWLKVFLCFIIYFIGGYLLYASFFAMFGSAANDSQEAQQFIMPVTVLLVLAFYVGFAAAKNPEGSLAFWGSIVPFTSPIVMMVRLPLEVPAWEIALSMALLFVTAAGTVMLAGKIYRTGILMHGKKASFKEIFKWIRYK